MSLNKKHKKQLEALRKKINHLKQQLAGAKKQRDEPQEVARLESELAALEAQVEKILHS